MSIKTASMVWDETISEVRRTVPAFDVVYKRDAWHMRALAVVVFWTDFRGVWQGFGRSAYMPDVVDLENLTWYDVKSLQHEATHVLDSCTFFGLLPCLPWWFNTVLFATVYLLVLPWPGFGRAWAELRGSRRDVENGGKPERYARRFQGSTYLWMLPLPTKTLVRLLARPSPYGDRLPDLPVWQGYPSE